MSGATSAAGSLAGCHHAPERTCTEIVRGLQAGQQVVLADLSEPLPSSATDASRTGTNRTGTIQIGNRTIQFGNGGFRVAQRANG